MTRLNDALERLVDRGTLTREQAAAVRDEVGADGPDGSSAGRGASGGRGRGAGSGARKGGVAPAAEAAAYVGGALTVVALGFLLADPWQDAPRGVRALLLAVLTAVLIGAGAALRDPDRDDPARGRVSGVLWVGAVLTAAGAAGILAEDALSDETAFLGTAGVALVVAAPLYLVQRSVGQLVALVGSAVAALVSLVVLAGGEIVAGGLVVAVLGAVVLALGLARVLEPVSISAPAGAFVALAGLQVATFEEDVRGGLLLVALVACVGLFVVATQTGALLSGVATLWLTILLPQAITHFGGGGTSIPVVLLVTGLALLGGAAMTNRIRRRD